MGDDVSSTRLRGIGIHDDRISYANLQARGTGNTNSAYTEAEPVAGTPEAQQASAAAFVATGTPSQEGSLTIRCQRAGGAGLEEGGFLWKDETATTPAWYGWDGPQLVTGWETLKWTSSTATDYSGTPHVIRLNSGLLLAVGIQNKINPLQITIKRYDPASSAWSTAATLTLEDPAEQHGACLVQLPQGRVLLYAETSSGDQVDCYYSDDDGSTWALYSARVLDLPVATADIQRLRAAYSSNEVLLVVEWVDGSSNRTASQYASHDLGARFDQILANWRTTIGEEPESIDIVSATGAGFVVGYSDNDHSSTVNAYTRKIGSAFVSLENPSPVLITAAATTTSAFVSQSMWRDEDGTLYGATKNQYGGIAAIKRSTDDAASWASYAVVTRALQLHATSGVTQFTHWSGATVGGRTALLTRWAAGTADEDPQSLGVVWLGGYSTHTAPAKTGATSYNDTDYVVLNESTALGVEGGLWLPIEGPQNVDWTGSGVGTDLVSPGCLEISTGGSARDYTRTVAASLDSVFGEVKLELDSGSGDTGTADVAVRIVLADAGGYHYEVQIRFSHAGYRVYDVSAAANIGAEEAVDFTAYKHLRVAMDQGRIKTWWAPHAHSRYWTEGPGGTVTDNGAGATNNTIQWGHIAASSDVSRWQLVGYCFWPGTWGPASSKLAGSWTSPDDLHPRSLPADPVLVHDGVSLAAKDGPAVVAQTWKIKQDALYPAANMHPEINPSPAAGWRSTGVIENKFVWDRGGLTLDSFEGSSVFLMLHRINFELAILESSTNGASWTIRGKVRARDGFDSLRFTRTGEIIQPEKGGASYDAGRYVVHGDFVNGTLYDSTNTKYRRIAENTSGLWSDRTGAIPRARIKGADDTEATAGTAELWMPSACVVVHEVAATDRYWRLRIPAATTADGFFEIGQLALGYVDVFGQQHGRGWTYEDRLIVDTQDLLNGSTRAVRRGDKVRRIELSWPDGSDTSQLHYSTLAPDYVTGTAGGLPVASYADVLLDLAGMADRKAGASVVWFGSIPRAGGDNAINDPRQWLWCRVSSSAVGRSNVLGDEVQTSLNRGDAIRLTEIT